MRYRRLIPDNLALDFQGINISKTKKHTTDALQLDAIETETVSGGRGSRKATGQYRSNEMSYTGIAPSADSRRLFG